MNIIARLYKTNGEVIEVSPKNNRDFTLEELQNFVEGDIEIINLTTEKILIVNEEGKINKLPFNESATELWREYYGRTDYIVGNALLCNSDEVR